MNKEKMKDKEVNLKHGYIFLTSILLVIFALFLSLEIYLKGGFNFNFSRAEAEKSDFTKEVNKNQPTIEIISLEDGYTTQESSITVVGKTENENAVWINCIEVDVNNEGIFELEIELIVGKNEILIEAVNLDNISSNLLFSIFREEIKEESKQEKKETEQSPKETPNIKPKPETPKNDTTKDPEPPKPTPPTTPPTSNITGLKMSCSITNSYPSIGQSIKLDCTVRDQNDNFVNGATGNAVLNWQSGQITYNFPSSSNGITSLSFTVPEENHGSIGGTIRITKDGLTVVSNFSITVQ